MVWKEYIVRFNRIAMGYGWTIEVPYQMQVVGYQQEEPSKEHPKGLLRMRDLGMGMGALRKCRRFLRKLREAER